MSELHQALESLGPVDWSDVPQDNLEGWMKQLFENGELICNSVPPPPGGTDFDQSQPTQSKPNAAKSAKDIANSEARPVPPHPDHAALQKSWGKPMKLSAKDNPLGISVYKMAAKDRHGAWFARRQVLEGISITKTRRAMQREFAESLASTGGPGAGNVRGIGGDRKLEKKDAGKAGRLEAYQLSAQFPGPTTPREFITLLLTSDNALSNKTTQDKGPIPRHYMVVSKPLTHPDAPDREGYVKGHYESVEMIREIPLNPAPEKEEDDKGDKHELNPVEWIMITRSDPGGGIPRFMVERGTPGSVCGDVSKFLDWACAKDEIPDADADEEKQQQAQEQHKQAPPPAAAPQQTTSSQPQQQQGGIFSSLTNAVEAGIEAYAPASVANATQNYLHPEAEDDTSSSSSDSDTDSFASAQDYHAISKHTTSNGAGVAASTDTLGDVSIASSTPPQGSSHHDKELRKIDKDRAKIETKIQKKRDVEASKLAQHKESSPDDIAKYQERYDSQMAKLEEKREKELHKLENKRDKEIEKAQKKRSKQLNRDEASRVARERDDFRNQTDMLKRENVLLRDQMADMQRENAILVEKVNKLGGVEALKDIKHDAEGQ